jgi:enoyl-CoA hydratase/carnithine racemase
MTAPDRELVRYEIRERVAFLFLDDPPANTYSHEMMRQLDDRILAARFDRDVDVIVLRGAGERFFCAGADVNMLLEADATWKYFFCLHSNETLLRLENTPKLVIAALNGHCVGGGLEVALACDIRLARRGGGKIGLPEVALGVLPGTGGTQRLTRLLGAARAMELMISGRKMDGDAAAAIGLVTEVLDSDGFDDAVFDYARRFTAPNAAAMAVGSIKRACVTGADVSLEQGLALERELQARLFVSDDAREGMAAFREKRSPRFSGR